MSMVAAVRYLCPWSGCTWSTTHPYHPLKGVFPNPSVVEHECQSHIDWVHAGQVPDVVATKPSPPQELDARYPRCCTPSRYGEPCVPQEGAGHSRHCRHCRRPM